jgi:hypothetical protein
VEFRDMRVRLLGALMTADDIAGEALAEHALQDSVVEMLRLNYDLYMGRNGVPPARDNDPASVGGLHIDMPTRPNSHVDTSTHTQTHTHTHTHTHFRPNLSPAPSVFHSTSPAY